MVRPRFAAHGEPGALRPLNCVGMEPGKGASTAHVLVGAADGCVLRIGDKRSVCASWRAHDASVRAVAFAGGGASGAATAGADGFVKLWALSIRKHREADSRFQIENGWRVELNSHTLLGSWDLRAASLIGDPGQKVCLAAAASHHDLQAFELLLFCGNGLHSIRVHGKNDDPLRMKMTTTSVGNADENAMMMGAAGAAEQRRRKLILANGRTADAESTCLMQGHRKTVHLLLAHPKAQIVLTVDKHTACLWHLDEIAGRTMIGATCEEALAPAAEKQIGAMRPAVTVDLPAAEGDPCSACFSQSGERWAIGLASGRILLVDVDGEAKFDGGPWAPTIGSGDSRIQRTLLDRPALSSPAARAVKVALNAAAQPPPSPVVCMAFNPEEELLASACHASAGKSGRSGVLRVHQLPYTLPQRRRRRTLLEVRSHVPHPTPYALPGQEPTVYQSVSCYLPIEYANVAGLLWSVSSAHVFAMTPANTASACHLQPDLRASHRLKTRPSAPLSGLVILQRPLWPQ